VYFTVLEYISLPKMLCERNPSAKNAKFVKKLRLVTEVVRGLGVSDGLVRCQAVCVGIGVGISVGVGV
jgi:hypothetical protein